MDRQSQSQIGRSTGMELVLPSISELSDLFQQALDCGGARIGVIDGTLKGNQSWGDNTFKPYLRAYINKMSNSKRFFHDLVLRVSQSSDFYKILQDQHLKYHLQPFKIQGLGCQTILQIFDLIVSKYEETHELQEDRLNWNQNQRRVFIWFIMFYSYFLQQQQQQLTEAHWQTLSAVFFNKSPRFLRFQFLNMMKSQRKITWSAEEDLLLVKAVGDQQAGKWNEVAKNIFFNSGHQVFKSPKHCRERWLNHLDATKKRGPWTAEEDLTILNFVLEKGKRWCKIVVVLDDARTEHMIKNRYNSIVSKHRTSKKEREEYIVLKITKQLKKQIANAAMRKRCRELKLKKKQESLIEASPARLQMETVVPIKIEAVDNSQVVEAGAQGANSPSDPVPNYYAQLDQSYYPFACNQFGLSYIGYPPMFSYGQIYWS